MRADNKPIGDDGVARLMMSSAPASCKVVLSRHGGGSVAMARGSEAVRAQLWSCDPGWVGI